MNIDDILRKHEIPKVAHNKFKAAIKEIIEETLKLAAEEATMVKSYNKSFEKYYDKTLATDDGYIEIYKESITNVINKIEGL